MIMTDPRPPVAPGEPAPDFTLPAVSGERTVSLADYRGRSPLFLGLLLGLWCPFCRRQIAQMSTTEGKLKALGVETLGVVATPPENARLYFKFRPARMRLAADPELSIHRAYRVPRPVPNPEMMQEMERIRVNPNGVLPEALPVQEAAMAVGRMDGYAANDTDQADMGRQWPQLKGLFLIDRDGIVRWNYIECSQEGLAGIGKLATEQEILDAAKALAR